MYTALVLAPNFIEILQKCGLFLVESLLGLRLLGHSRRRKRRKRRGGGRGGGSGWGSPVPVSAWRQR